MIVVDEAIHSHTILASIATWYRGQVVSITTLRPGSVIRDDAIPVLLRPLSKPTFVMTNVDDFWRIVPPLSRYCIVCLAIPRERNSEAPVILRDLFGMMEFRTKVQRMGKIVRVSLTTISFYDVRREVVNIF